MIFLGLVFVIALASAAEVAEVPVQKSFLDIFVFNSNYKLQDYSEPDLYQSPVIVLAEDQKSTGLVAYYADNGLRSVLDYGNFEPVSKLLRGSSHLSGLLLSYKEFYDNPFFSSAVGRFVLPDHMKVSDLLREVQPKALPVLYLATKPVFSSHHFVGLKHIQRFAVSEANIEPVQGSFTAQPSRFQFFNFQNFAGYPNYLNYGVYPFQYYNNYHKGYQGYGKSPISSPDSGNYFSYYPPNGYLQYSTFNNNNKKKPFTVNQNSNQQKTLF